MRRDALALIFLALAALACNMPRGPVAPAVLPTAAALADQTALPGGTPQSEENHARYGWRTYTVAEGDTLGEIAELTGSTVADLAAANGLADPGEIYVGQTLAIPALIEGATAHTVAQGETLGQIARLYGVSESAISAANGIANPDLIYAGQALAIPGAPTPAAANRVYLDVPIVKQSRNLSCESATACSLMRYMGYGCSDDTVVFNALPRSYDNPHQGFVGPVDSEAGSLPPGAATEKVGGYGAYVEPVHAGLAALGVKAQYAYGASLDALRALLDQGAPVMIIATHGMGIYGYESVTFTPQDGDGGSVTVIRYEHSYAVVGYDAGGFWAIDPWSGSVDYFDNARFDADWARLGRQALWLTRA